jgi:hypothetical protein
MPTSLKITVGAIPVVLLREFSAANVRSALQTWATRATRTVATGPAARRGQRGGFYQVAQLCLCSYPAISRSGRDIVALPAAAS